jgi:uncharacterized protein (TIGR02118 family)
MIRLTFLLRRKPEQSREEFQHYWLHEHGPLVASHANHLNLLRYVQVHTLDDPINGGMNEARGGKMEAPYDGVAELWWENDDLLQAAFGSQEGEKAGAELLEDEAKFIDLPNSPLWLNCEYPQINPTPENIIASVKSNIVKLHFPLRCQASMPEDEVRAYWLQNHGPIIRSHAQASGILRYQQVHRIEHPLEAALRDSRGTIVEPYLGHAEVWFSTDRVQTAASKAANLAAVEDESKFIDFERSAMFIAKEHVIVDRR